jgi:hypothetical protein
MDKKIAFCFLTYNSLEMEILWRDFLGEIDASKYSVYIHAKDPEDVNFMHFKDRVITDPVETQYFHPSLVQAQNKLLEHALKDKKNTHFVFLCGSSVPIKPFDYIYDNLTDNSIFNMRKHESDLIELKDQYLSVLRKCSQWCILNRFHAEKILECIPDIYFVCKNNEIPFNGAPDEKVYLSFLLSNFSENISILKGIENHSMFEYWSSNQIDIFEKNFISSQHVHWPERQKSFYFINKDEINFIMKSNAFFIRKICRHSYIFNQDHGFCIEGRANPKDLKKSLQNRIFKDDGVLLSNFLKKTVTP